jgi:Protein of unknown function (DUF3768)
MTTTKTEQIRALNDRLRQQLRVSDGTAVITMGIAALGDEAAARIFRTIAVYDDFCRDNDPYAEHDFGAFESRVNLFQDRLLRPNPHLPLQ